MLKIATAYYKNLYATKNTKDKTKQKVLSNLKRKMSLKDKEAL